MNQVLQIVRLLHPYWRFIGQSLLVGAMISLLSLPGPYLTKMLIDDVYPHQDFALLDFVLLVGAAVSLFAGLAGALSAHFGRRVGIGMGFDFQARLYRHLQRLDFGFFDRRETGEILSRFDDMQASIGNVIAMISALVMNSLQLLIFPAVLFYLNWQLALISLAVLPFDALLAVGTRSHYQRLATRIAEEGAALSARAYESLASIRTIQALGLEANFFEKLRDRFLGVARLQIRASLLQQGSGFASAVIRSAGSLAYGWYGWSRVLQGDLSLGTFMAFSGYTGYLYGPIQSLIGLLPQLESTLVHTRRFLEVYELRPAIEDRLGAVPLKEVRGEIAFCGVSFGYNGTPVLRNLNLKIPARQCLALVGRSGAGKSTLVKLIPRFYDPTEGYVALDGRDIRQYQLKSLRRRVGFAMQGSAIFQGTIWENLTFGRDIPVQDVEDAARAAYIHNFVISLPQGYHTPLGEGGAGISEGQKQRLALARVLLLDTPILILDEPTSALDAESEEAIRKALRTVREGRTTIIIAHRPATIQEADEVVVLKGGQIAEYKG